VDPALYHQDFDLALLLRLYERLSNRRVIDVGAERGAFAAAFVGAGCPELYAIEPLPRHAQHLRERFAAAPVRVLECAVGARDETAILHLADDPAGREYDYHHSLVPMPDTPEVRWHRALPVRCRMLGSLVQEGALPAEVGVLKIDTEGNDLPVLQGLGALTSAVVVVEHWDGCPNAGPCPYPASALRDALLPRGYGNFAFLKRHDEFQVVQVNDCRTRAGDWGNLVFVHDSAFAAVAPVIHEACSDAQARLVDQALEFRRQCTARMAVIDRLQAECDARHAVIERLRTESPRKTQ
jgi:FkbM family methyltransferase